MIRKLASIFSGSFWVHDMDINIHPDMIIMEEQSMILGIKAME